jgi:hypothetical protein
MCAVWQNLSLPMANSVEMISVFRCKICRWPRQSSCLIHSIKGKADLCNTGELGDLRWCCSEWWRLVPNVIFVWLVFLGIREASSWNVSPGTDCLDWAYSWFSSVRAGKRRVSYSSWVSTAFFLILSSLLFSKPHIRRCMTCDWNVFNLSKPSGY